MTPEDFIEAYRSAFEDGDVDAMLALYSDDVRVFDVEEPSEYEDKEAWSMRMYLWLGAFGGQRRCRFSFVQIISSDAITVISADVAFEGAVAGASVSFLPRMTFVLGRFGEDLLVIHEHGSVPVRG